MKKFAWILTAMSAFSVMLAGCAAEEADMDNDGAVEEVEDMEEE
ncbi:MAG: hypothetical protein ACOCX1_00560 [Fimbriimonadaceae bacterium]